MGWRFHASLKEFNQQITVIKKPLVKVFWWLDLYQTWVYSICWFYSLIDSRCRNQTDAVVVSRRFCRCNLPHPLHRAGQTPSSRSRLVHEEGEVGSSATCKPLPSDQFSRCRTYVSTNYSVMQVSAYGIIMTACVSLCMTERAYKVKEVSELLQVDPRRVRQFCNDGTIRCLKIGSEFRIPESAYLEYLHSCK